MADDPNKTEDPLKKDNPPKDDPPSDDPGDKGKKDSKDPSDSHDDDVPEKFKGKSVADIAKAYLELEKMHGATTEEVGKVRKDIESIGRVLEENPDLKQAFLDAIAKKSPKKDEKKEDKDDDNKTPVQDDARITLENRIIDDFSQKYGIHRLSEEKQKEILKKVGKEIKEMLDYTGDKSPSEIVAKIPLTRLSTYLEKAYALVTQGDRDERVRSEAYVKAKENNEAAIGSITSTGVTETNVELTQGEKEVARRMNISEEDYKKQKIAIAKGE